MMNSFYSDKLQAKKCNVEMPEGVSEDFLTEVIDDQAVENFQNLADELGLTEQQAEGIWCWILQGAARFVGQFNKKAEDYCCEVDREMYEKFGKDYERKKRAAVHLIHQYGGRELAEFLKDTGIGNRKEVVSFMMNLADVLGEDRGLAGEKSAVFSSDDKIKDEIARLMAHPGYMQARHPEHDRMVNKVYGLRKQLSNEEKLG